MNNISTLKNLYQKIFIIVFAATTLLFSATLYAFAVTDTTGYEAPGSKISYDKKSTSVEFGTPKNKIIHDQRPTALEYALMSQCAYKDGFKKGDKCEDLPGWEIHDLDNKIVESNTGFNYLIFKNNDTRQIVIAYRGTVPTSLNDLWEDVLGISLNAISPQKKEAFKLVFDAVKLVDKKITDYIKREGYTLSFTGHSLGAFLAEMSVFFCHENQINYPLASAVTFESPGSLESMQALQANLDPKIDLSDLDIIGYVGTPNVINTANHHVGSLYQIEHELGEYGNSIMYTLNCHSIDNIVPYFKKCISGSCGMHYMARWPIFSLTQEQSRNFFELSEWDEKCKFYRIPEEYFAYPERVFSLKYTAGYDINEMFQPFYSLSLKHVQPGLRNFLLKYRDTFSSINQSSNEKEKFIIELTSRGVPKEIINCLVSVEVVSFHKDDMLYLHDTNNEVSYDVFRFKNKLSEYLQDESNFKKIANVLDPVHSAQKRCNFNVVNNVPDLGIYIQERKNELDDIHKKSFKDDGKGIALICIAGFSGSGKSKLAIKYALDKVAYYRHIGFFNAADSKKLYNSFLSFARRLCHDDLHKCYDEAKDKLEDCVNDIVRACLHEETGEFLWIFDNAKTYEEIEKYIPYEKGVSGVILITTQNQLEFNKYPFINLDGGLKEEESYSLLTKTIQEANKEVNINKICKDEEIKKIAVKILRNLPLPIFYNGELISEIGCQKYIKMHSSNPKKINDLLKGIKLQEELIQGQLSFLSPLNLEIIGFLSFIETPFPSSLVVFYINANSKYREMLDLTPVDEATKHSLYEKIDITDEIKINREIKKLNIIKVSDDKLFFPHEIFKEQAQLFLLKKDKKNADSYNKLFNRTTEFFCKKFSGCFWDKLAWKDEKKTLLPSVEKIVNDFVENKEFTLTGNENMDIHQNEKSGLLNDCQFILLHRLGKSYLQKNPEDAVKLLNDLHNKIVNNKKQPDDSSEYLKNSVNHAVVMHDLVAANCQAQYMSDKNTSFNLEKIEMLAKSAYEIFKKKLGKENPRTLNAYLTLTHIAVNLKQNVSITKAQNMVDFLGPEPTIIAAIELSGLQLETKEFESLREELSWPEKFKKNVTYSAIYANMEKRLGVVS